MLYPYAVENEICAMMKSKNLELVCSLAIGYPKNLAFTQKHRNKFKDNFVQFKKAEFNLYQNNLCLLESENKPNLQK